MKGTKGSIRKRGGVYQGRVDVGIDPATGKRKVFYVSKAKKGEVQDEITDILSKLKKGEYVEPSKLTVGAWLETWFELVKPSLEFRSVETYRSILDQHIGPALGAHELQKLQPEHIETYFNERRGKLKDSTLAQHGAILHSALKNAEAKKKIHRNPSTLVANKPKRRRDHHEDAMKHCWDDVEARALLGAARAAGPQQAAFYSMALELGLRKGELCGLRWVDVDFERGSVLIAQQLVKVGAKDRAPLFGSPKGGRVRRLDISPGLVDLLRAHRSHQAEVKLKNRLAYHDHGLVFAKEGRIRGTERAGDPIQANNIAEREFHGLIKKAEIRRIKFHGLRHTSATLALQNGVPVKVVQERLGHQRIEITMDIYAHAMPSAQKDAASRMGSLLHR